MGKLTTIDRSAIKVNMIILFIHDGYINPGKVIETSPRLKMMICNDQYGIANTIHRIYFHPTSDRPSEGIYLCPGEIADRLVFDDSPISIMTLP